MNYSTEQFSVTKGFSLITGMSYKLLSKVPTIDTKGEIFFTTKTVRDWTFGVKNSKFDDFIFEHIFLLNEKEKLELQVNLKQAEIKIPFEATVHFDNTTFTQNFDGIWSGYVTYDYEVGPTENF